MSTRTRVGPFGFADFLELVNEDQKADLLEGTIHMASPESLDHNGLVRWLVTVLGQYVEVRRLGRVTVNKVAFRLAHHTAPEPDVAFIQAGRLHLLKSGYVDGPPDLAIEIVSPDSVDRDYQAKRSIYASAGVPEYWIIDPDERRAAFLGQEAGQFVDLPIVSHIFQSRVVAGFSLDTRWLWQRPLPETLGIVQGLLARGESSTR